MCLTIVPLVRPKPGEAVVPQSYLSSTPKSTTSDPIRSNLTRAECKPVSAFCVLLKQSSKLQPAFGSNPNINLVMSSILKMCFLTPLHHKSSLAHYRPNGLMLSWARSQGNFQDRLALISRNAGTIWNQVISR